MITHSWISRIVRVFGLLIVLQFLTQSAFAQQSIADQFVLRSFKSGRLTFPYRIFVPQQYSDAVSYPLVLALHGTTGPTYPHEYQFVNARLATVWAEPSNQEKYPAFVVFPEYDNFWAFGDMRAAFSSLLDSLSVEYAIDPDRMYLTGISLGGFVGWNWVQKEPDRFAAFVPMAGTDGDSDAKMVAQLPQWNFHGRSDDVVSIGPTRALMRNFEAIGRDVAYTHCNPVDCVPMSVQTYESLRKQHHDLFFTEYEFGDHFIFVESYDNPWLVPWVYAQHRPVPGVVQLQISADGGRLSGPVDFVPQMSPDADRSEVWLIRNFNPIWQLIGEVEPGGILRLDTQTLEDAAFATFRAVALDSMGLAIGSATSGLMTIDNPGNGEPFIRLMPFPGVHQTRLTTDVGHVSFQAADPEGDSLQIGIQYAADGGEDFVPVLSVRLPSDTTAQTIDVPLGEQANSESAMLLVTVSDGEYSATDRSRIFKKATTRLRHGEVEHISGDSGAKVDLWLVGEVLPDPAEYRLTFRQFASALVYDVTDVVSGDIVVADGGSLDGAEGPLFGGLRLSIRDLTRGVFNRERSSWSRAEIGLQVAANAAPAYIGGMTFSAVATPADYRIEWHENTIGTSSTLFGTAALPMSFSVHNVTDDRLVDVVFLDNNGDTWPSPGEIVYLLEPDTVGNLTFAWRLSFSGPESATLPDPGDAYDFYTLKPLSEDDVYLLSTNEIVATEPEVPPAPAGVRIEAPFPNPFGWAVRIPFSLKDPDQVRLEVFDVLGRRVARVLEGEFLDAGPHEGLFEAGDLPNGVYLVRLTTSTVSVSKSVTRLQ